MTDRSQIESILKVNGLGKTAPDEEIRSVLLSARFNKDEVDTALMILRENTKTSETRVDGLHKVFRSDRVLQPNEISKLLGIDISLRDEVSSATDVKRFSAIELALLSTVSALLAVVCVLLYMYTQNIGWFHPSVSEPVNFARSA